MANGEVCKHCGYYETNHDPDTAPGVRCAELPSGKRCYRFVSERKHKRGCPKVGCDGNCDTTIAKAKAHKAHINRQRHDD